MGNKLKIKRNSEESGTIFIVADLNQVKFPIKTDMGKLKLRLSDAALDVSDFKHYSNIIFHN